MKNIGFVSYWFNRGQAVVTKYVKSIFDEAGYNTFVLTKSPKKRISLKSLSSTRGIKNIFTELSNKIKQKSDFEISQDWIDENITIGSQTNQIEKSKYLEWADINKLDICFFDQNYQFREIKALKETGVKTIGRFVWEQFAPEHANEANDAFDIIYSLTNCEHNRYLKELNINSKLIRWGIHPSLLNHNIKKEKKGPIKFYYPAGYCGSRKSVNETIEAFRKVKNDNIRLFISSQKPINSYGDSRIIVDSGNISSHKEFHKKMYSCDVCIIPSRWEGLGLAFVESIAFEMPILTTDYPPMNEYVLPNETGFLINCNTKNKRKNGIWIADISIKNLSEKIAKIADRVTINRMSKNTKDILQKKYAWDKTIEDYKDLIK
tara:strand:- start:302 stop:1432 length:1131 start_codon:yes stop_codon:yes gene_type:complete